MKAKLSSFSIVKKKFAVEHVSFANRRVTFCESFGYIEYLSEFLILRKVKQAGICKSFASYIEKVMSLFIKVMH